MEESMLAGLQVLGHDELDRTLGGMVLMPTLESSWIYDLFWCLGRAAHETVTALQNPPVANYAYAKVGYAN